MGQDAFAKGDGKTHKDRQPCGLERKRREHGLGLDIMTSREGTEVLGHTGGVDGYFTAGFYVPARDSVLVLYMNRSDEEIFGPLFGQCLREVVAG